MNALDTKTGELHLENGLVIRGGESLQQLRSEGLSFVRVLPMGKGWTMCSTSDLAFAGHATYFSLQVYEDTVTSVSFGFAEERGIDELAKLSHYKEFLRLHLGDPDITGPNNEITSYKYDWGNITAIYDSRNGSSSMAMGWRKIQEEAQLRMGNER